MVLAFHMTLQELLLNKLQSLSPQQRLEVWEFVSQLSAAPKKGKSIIGLFEHLGVRFDEADASVVDLTGLPDGAAEAVRAIIDVMRQQAGLQQPVVSPEGWRKRFEDYMEQVSARASRYPQGFVLDDSRESIHEGRGE
jgi:hypothetical protein